MAHQLAATYARAYQAINYRLRTFGGGRWAAYCRPTSIGILLTERCNARCVHCGIWKNRGREEQPSPEQWKTTLRDLHGWLPRLSVASRRPISSHAKAVRVLALSEHQLNDTSFPEPLI